MAHDDMYVVMYKVIAYLYGCMKKGTPPSDDEYSAEALGIPQQYWACVMRELADHGYIAGASVLFGGYVVQPVAPRVTMEGVAFLEESSMMGRAKAFLKEAEASVPFV